MITLEPYRKETEKQYRALYLSAFPKEERAPWWLLKRRAKQGRAEALAAMDDGRFAGMAYVVTLGDMAYLFYLAVEEGQRGRGHRRKDNRGAARALPGQADLPCEGTAGRIRRELSAAREPSSLLPRERLPGLGHYHKGGSRYIRRYGDWNAGDSAGIPRADKRWAGKLPGLFFRAYME